VHSPLCECVNMSDARVSSVNASFTAVYSDVVLRQRSSRNTCGLRLDLVLNVVVLVFVWVWYSPLISAPRMYRLADD